MKITKAKKILTLTREEQKVIHDIYKILDEDGSLNVNGVWDILTDIYIGDDSDDSVATDYGYQLEFID